jgi:two-component system response regulator HydG
MLLAPLRILVVDDDVDTCENLRDILTDCGHSVAVAHSGEDALPLLRREAFDLALLDFKMPGMDGLMLYREIRKLRSGTVAVIISAYASRETAEQALEAGACSVLHKPVQFEQLLPLIDLTTRQPLILVVDDDRELCSNLWDILRERGYRVDIAHSEQEAAYQLAGRQHGIVLIDMRLPQGDGSGVFHLVRESNPGARVILITGYRCDLEDVVERVVAEGAEAVCYKPFEIPDLIGTIARLTANRTRPS